jgi:hypothetical protein
MPIILCLSTILLIGWAGSAAAQDPSPAEVANPSSTLVLPSSGEGEAGSASQPAPTNRACDGCPERRVGHALLQSAAYINTIYGLANLIRGQDTAKITPKTWWANMKNGWEWDLDDFVVNQFGHPYQGNNYFNAGRANGLSFWESAGITALGSGTWEFFGETNQASLNDLLNTTLGGIALGEMFHRTAWLVRDTRKSGRGRLMSEIGATVLDPVTGLNRFISGDASRVSEMPPELVPSSLTGYLSAGALWRGDESTGHLTESASPFAELDMLYGDITKGRSREPYEAFVVRLRLGGGFAFSEARVRGRLMGQPTVKGHLQINVSQAYDFQKNNAYDFGAQSFEVSVSRDWALSKRATVSLSGWGGLTALGAVDSVGVPGKESESETPQQGESIEPRHYDYGPGSDFGGSAVFSRNNRIFAVVFYQAHHLYVVDGPRANHLLQQGRIDLLAPLKGPLGVGVSGEYFDRHTFFQGPDDVVTKLHFPQVRIYLTWRMS